MSLECIMNDDDDGDEGDDADVDTCRLARERGVGCSLLFSRGGNNDTTEQEEDRRRPSPKVVRSDLDEGFGDGDVEADGADEEFVAGGEGRAAVVEPEPGAVGGGFGVGAAVAEFVAAAVAAEDAGVFGGDGGVDGEGLAVDVAREGDVVGGAAAERRAFLGVDEEVGADEGRAFGREAREHERPRVVGDVELVAAEHEARAGAQRRGGAGAEAVEGPGRRAEVFEAKGAALVGDGEVAPRHGGLGERHDVVFEGRVRLLAATDDAAGRDLEAPAVPLGVARTQALEHEHRLRRQLFATRQWSVVVARPRVRHARRRARRGGHALRRRVERGAALVEEALDNNFKFRFGISSLCSSFSAVSGEESLVKSHRSIAERSYEWPSAAITGSRISVWSIGHVNSSRSRWSDSNATSTTRGFVLPTGILSSGGARVRAAAALAAAASPRGDAVAALAGGCVSSAAVAALAVGR
eukprot:CAMPEP_0198666370 /NCGR_PEP_ID=MMETSP1467-20131203/64343_1 /TAXON_ID=1462469 /ORGANISM="unid. sp., Strain CCMP2135" /LENGTH=467 /DNA_ID=CAMNT_0044403013 /DNA_START=45 /DNA_END=1448 /DNA_ORIENTATION=+